MSDLINFNVIRIPFLSGSGSGDFQAQAQQPFWEGGLAEPSLGSGLAMLFFGRSASTKRPFGTQLNVAGGSAWELGSPRPPWEWARQAFLGRWARRVLLGKLARRALFGRKANTKRPCGTK